MKKLTLFTLFLALLFVATNLYAEEQVRKISMEDSLAGARALFPRFPDWVTQDSTGSKARSMWFYLPHRENKGLSRYTGSATLIFWADSTVAQTPITANLDTSGIVVTYLVYDHVDAQYEETSQPVAGDSTHIKTDWKWRTGHDDNTYQFSVVLDFRRGFQAIKLTVTSEALTQAFRWRSVLWISDDR